MLTRIQNTDMFPTVVKKTTQAWKPVSTNDTKKAVSKDIPLFFLCDVSPYLKLQGCIDIGDSLSLLVFRWLPVFHPILNVALSICGKIKGLPVNFFNQRRSFMTNTKSTPTVPNPVSSIPNESYYTVSLGKQSGTMGIIIKYHIDNARWRFVDISAGITFLINPDTNSIHFPQSAHDKAIELFSNELQKFVSQRFPHGCEKDSHTKITLEQPKLIGEPQMSNELMTINRITSVELTTIEIAELTSKRHDNVLVDTKKMLTELYGEEGFLNFQETYIHPQNKQIYPCYKLPKNEVLILISGYSIPLRAAIVRRLDELEKQVMPKTLPEALRAYANELEMKELAMKQRDEAIKTKAWISDKKTATAMATASVAVRQAETLKDQIGESKTWKTVKAIPWLKDCFELSKPAYKAIGVQLSKISKALGLSPKKVPDTEWGNINAYHIDVIEHFKHKIMYDLNMLRVYRKSLN